MSETRVIHYRDWDRSDKNTVYIGRAMPRQRLKASRWANPFRIDKDGTREEVIQRYRDYLQGWFHGDASLFLDLAELSGKTLVCWCKPEMCHGDVLAEIADRIKADLSAQEDYYGELADAASL